MTRDGCTVATSQAIDESIARNMIVTVDYTPTLAIELFDACDGDVYDAERKVHEYWGTLERVGKYGEERCQWRVHLRGAP